MFNLNAMNSVLPKEYQVYTKPYSSCYYFGKDEMLICEKFRRDSANNVMMLQAIKGEIDLYELIPNHDRFLIRNSTVRGIKMNCTQLAKKCSLNKLPLIVVLPNNSRQVGQPNWERYTDTVLLDLTKVFSKNTDTLESLLFFAEMIGSYTNKGNVYWDTFVKILNENVLELTETGIAKYYYSGKFYSQSELYLLIKTIYPLCCDYIFPLGSYPYRTVSFKHFLNCGLGIDSPNRRVNALHLFESENLRNKANTLTGLLQNLLEEHGYFTLLDIHIIVSSRPFGFSYTNIECFVLGCALRPFQGLLFQDMMELTYIAEADTFTNHLTSFIQNQHAGRALKPIEQKQAESEFFFQHEEYIDIFANGTKEIFDLEETQYFISHTLIGVTHRINSYQHVFYFIEEYFRSKGLTAYADLTNTYYKLCSADGHNGAAAKLKLLRSAAGLLGNIDRQDYKHALTEGNIKEGMDIFFNGSDYYEVLRLLPVAGRWLWSKDSYLPYVGKGENNG